MSNITEITYEEFLELEGPQLIYFCKSNCQPCKAMAPVYQEVGLSLGLAVWKINIEEEPIAITELNIRSAPTFILWNSEERSRVIGICPVDSITDLFRSYL